MKDPFDTLTEDLFAQATVPMEHNGRKINLFADHEAAEFMMVEKATSRMYCFYKEDGKDFWSMYIFGLHANKYDPDKTLEQLWNEYTYYDDFKPSRIIEPMTPAEFKARAQAIAEELIHSIKTTVKERHS